MRVQSEPQASGLHPAVFARTTTHPDTEYLRKETTNPMAMMGMLYWRYGLQLRGLPAPEEYPLQELWEAHQDELPQFVSQFRADNGL